MADDGLHRLELNLRSNEASGLLAVEDERLLEARVDLEVLGCAGRGRDRGLRRRHRALPRHQLGEVGR